MIWSHAHASARAAALALALIALGACSSDATHSTADAAATADGARPVPGGRDAPAAPDAAPAIPDAAVGSMLALAVPATYTGTPRELAVVGTKKVPIAGPPDVVFVVDNMPAPVAGQTMHLTLDTSGASGDLYVVAVLYQQGGGQYSPESGVDYVAQSASTFHFTGAPIDLGTLDLALAP